MEPESLPSISARPDTKLADWIREERLTQNLVHWTPDSEDDDNNFPLDHPRREFTQIVPLVQVISLNGFYIVEGGEFDGEKFLPRVRVATQDEPLAEDFLHRFSARWKDYLLDRDSPESAPSCWHSHINIANELPDGWCRNERNSEAISWVNSTAEVTIDVTVEGDGKFSVQLSDKFESSGLFCEGKVIAENTDEIEETVVEMARCCDAYGDRPQLL